jgi:ketosteroid isomerase-like protein
MKKLQISIVLAAILLLGACSSKDETSPGHGTVNDGEAVNGYGSIDHGVDDKKVGFNLTGNTIEEAAGVPAEEKERILATFEIYIDAFNEKDIDRYLETVSDQTDSFDKAEERAYMTNIFSSYNLDRQATDVTIVKYTETEAQVFAKLKTSLKQLSSGLQTNQSGRQVTVFTKEEEEWKVSSVHYLGDVE